MGDQPCFHESPKFGMFGTIAWSLRSRTVCGEVDLREWIVGKGGVFGPLEDINTFRTVTVQPEFGTIQWPNGVDFCPDVLYSAVTGEPIPFAEPDDAPATPQRRSA